MTKPTAQALGPIDGHRGTVFAEGDLAAQVPDLSAELHGTGIDAQAFAAWLQPLLVDFRAGEAAKALMGQRLAVVRWLEAAAADPETALGDGRLQHPPEWHAAPALWHAAQQQGEEWDHLVATGYSPKAAAVLRAAAAMLKARSRKRGRRTSRARDLLLRAVVDRLRRHGLGVGDATHRAAGILVLCRVPVPDASATRAARRAGPRAHSVLAVSDAPPFNGGHHAKPPAGA